MITFRVRVNDDVNRLHYPQHGSGDLDGASRVSRPIRSRRRSCLFARDALLWADLTRGFRSVTVLHELEVRNIGIGAAGLTLTSTRPAQLTTRPSCGGSPSTIRRRTITISDVAPANDEESVFIWRQIQGAEPVAAISSR